MELNPLMVRSTLSVASVVASDRAWEKPLAAVTKVKSHALAATTR